MDRDEHATGREPALGNDEEQRHQRRESVLWVVIPIAFVVVLAAIYWPR